jgi:hypothetical protein
MLRASWHTTATPARRTAAGHGPSPQTLPAPLRACKARFASVTIKPSEPFTPMLSRPVIAVALLTAHPGNVRRDLDLNSDFLASIKEDGVLVRYGSPPIPMRSTG